ncbi:hypothetical protein WDD9_001780 [Paenibacillus melissococcoides]|nr:hypothetical protein [Paenibacillus melissococcoides]CAH8708039.1 hypothetical protein WDD9_001780 [Paenibacillus melissococcoides]CAH8708745.1 hypothetical protein HTL2_002065 [Paenibacillus melissococcoides]
MTLLFSLLLGLLPEGLLFTPTAKAQMSFKQLTDVNIVSVAVGSYHQLALDDEGRVWAWGENVNNKQGLGSKGTHTDPIQVTQTNTGAPLPKIKRIAAGYQNSLLLDVDGNVWSAGAGNNYANGNNSTSNCSYFTQVPLTEKAVYIASGHYSGIAVGESGNLWYWGRAGDAAEGMNTTTNLRIPTKITTGTTNIGNTADAANNVDISSIKFIAAEITDWTDTHGGAGIALTEDGDIWTWGVGRNSDALMLASGGSYRPKKVTSVHSTSSIQTLPRNIVKIDAGVGSFAMLDADGNLWTWGANWAFSTNSGILGQGITGSHLAAENRLNAPKRVDYIRTSSTSTTNTEAPKFVDFGLYAWNLHAVDSEGNIYATGELRYNTDIGVGNFKTYLTKGVLPADANAGKILRTSGGHYGGVLFIDINGNVWEQGNYTAGTSSKLTLATFPKTRGLFTSISATDVSTTPVLDTSGKPVVDAYGNIVYEKKIIYKDKYLDGTQVANLVDSGATLTANVTTPAGATLQEVQYVMLYDNDPYYKKVVEQFNSGLGEWGNEVVLNNKNDKGQVVIASQSYPHFQNYVSEIVTEEIFNELYTQKADTRKSGTMTPTTTTGSYTMTVNDNSVILLQSVTSKSGVKYTNRMFYEFGTFLTPIRLYHKGVKEEYNNDHFDKTDVNYQVDANLNFTLYGGKPYEGPNTRLYGLYYDRDGNFVPEKSIDSVKVYPDTVDLWLLRPDEAAQVVEIPLNSEIYQEKEDRLDGVDTSLLPDTRYSSDGTYYYDSANEVMYYKASDGKYYALFTYTYAKDPSKWGTVKLHYIDTDLNNINVWEDDLSVFRANPEDVGSFAPIGIPFIQGHSPFTPPLPEDPDDKPIGYILVDAGGSPDINNLVACSFPEGFNPTVSLGQEIYIVYEAGMKTVTEHFVLDTKDGNKIAKDSSAQIKNGEDYNKTAHDIKGHVAVAAWTKNINGDGVEVYPEQYGSYGNNVTVTISPVTDNWDVYYVYKVDSNNDGIPDEYEGWLNVNWIGVNEDGSTTLLGSDKYIGDGRKNPADQKVFSDHEGDTHGATQTPGSLSWIFNESATKKSNWSAANDALNHGFPSLPITYNYEFEHKSDILNFYYDIDANGNGVADKDEGLIRERYQTIDGGKLVDENGDPMLDDTTTKKIEGDTYSKLAPDIPGYVPVQVRLDTYTTATDIDEGTRTNETIANIDYVSKFGNVVTFFYMVDANNNGIPDDLEGKITVQWVAVTASGSQVVLNERELYGIGQDIGPGNPWYDQYGLVYVADTGSVHANEFTPSSQWLFDTGEYDTPPRDVLTEYGYTGQWYFDYKFDSNNEQKLCFYYDEDYNENSYPDRLEPMLLRLSEKWEMSSSITMLLTRA